MAQDTVQDSDAIEMVEIKIPKAILREYEYISSGYGCSCEDLISRVLLAASNELSPQTGGI